MYFAHWEIAYEKISGTLSNQLESTESSMIVIFQSEIPSKSKMITGLSYFHYGDSKIPDQPESERKYLITDVNEFNSQSERQRNRKYFWGGEYLGGQTTSLRLLGMEI